MNRSFPGKERSNTTERMANRIYRRFVAQCDLGLDFHVDPESDDDLPRPGRPRQPRSPATRAGVRDERGAVRIRRRGVAPVDGDRGRDPDRHGRDGARTPVPAGAHRRRWRGRERPRRVRAHARRGGPLAGWFQSTAADSTKRWLRADTGGLVEMEWGPYPLVYEGETICTITNHFKTEEHAIEAPSTG